MTAILDLVKQMNTACDSKDFETARALFHPQYTLRGPSMEVNSAEEMITGMETCPFASRAENFTFIVEGNTVVQVFDWVVTEPASFRTRMCDVVTIEDGKIRSEELFFDTAKMPAEILKFMQEPPQGTKKAA